MKITHKYTLGDLSMQTFCVRFDPNDKYIAAGNFHSVLFVKVVGMVQSGYSMSSQVNKAMY